MEWNQFLPMHPCSFAALHILFQIPFVLLRYVRHVLDKDFGIFVSAWTSSIKGSLPYTTCLNGPAFYYTIGYQ